MSKPYIPVYMDRYFTINKKALIQNYPKIDNLLDRIKANIDRLTWLDLPDDELYLKDGNVFKTEGEAVCCALKILNKHTQKDAQ